MATISRLYSFVAAAVPTAAQWNQDIDQLISTINGSIDSGNVTLSGASGLMDLTSTQTASGIKTFTTKVYYTAAYGSYIKLGVTRLWEDLTNGCLRVKHGSDPSTETDGNILMEG